jgi:flagellar assembly protein FliH
MARERFIPSRDGVPPPVDSPFLERGARRVAGRFQRFDANSFAHLEESDKVAPAANDPGPTDARQRASQAAQPRGAEAEEIDATQALEAMRIAAREEGLAQGIEEGRAAGRREWESQLKGLAKSIGEIENLRASMVNAYRRELAELALQIANSLVLRELQGGRETVEHMVRQALDALDSHDAMTLHLAASVLEQDADFFAHLQQKHNELQIVADPSFGPGDFRLESRAGNVTMMLEERLAAVRRLVLGAEPELSVAKPNRERPR